MSEEVKADTLWKRRHADDPDNGWTYKFSEVENVAKEAAERTGYDYTLEVIEAVMQIADERLAALSTTRPSQPAVAREEGSVDLDREFIRTDVEVIADDKSANPLCDYDRRILRRAATLLTPEPLSSAVDGGAIPVGGVKGTEPYAMSVLGGRFDETCGEWVYAVVATPLITPFTHWWPLPDAFAYTPATPPADVAVREALDVLPFSEWHEDHGDVLWWRLPIQESPYVGSPLDMGRSMKVVVNVGFEEHDLPITMTGGWPFDEDDEGRLFWTPLPDAAQIAALAAGGGR